MKKYQFASNIKCENCEAKIREAFQQEENIQNFSVDLTHKQRLLTVETTETFAPEQVVAVVAKAGFEAKLKKKGFWRR